MKTEKFKNQGPFLEGMDPYEEPKGFTFGSKPKEGEDSKKAKTEPIEKDLEARAQEKKNRTDKGTLVN